MRAGEFILSVLMRRVIILFACLALWMTVGTLEAYAAPPEGASPAPALSPVLSKSDAQRYRLIFAAQEKGRWKTADTQIRRLNDKILMGYVLEQRYMHPTAYRSSYPELSRWLNAYADHPEAADIYRLAKRRQGRALPPQRPQGRRWRTAPKAPMHPVLEADYKNNGSEIRSIERRLRRLTRQLKSDQALAYLMHPKQFNRLTAAQTDRARGWIAASYYYEGNLKKAQQVADLATRRSSDSAVLSYWIAGLVAFRQNDMERAYRNFSAQANIPYQAEDLRAAGAFWAVRAATARGQMEDALTYLYVAADHPMTFYGQLALAQLGLDPAINWQVPAVDDADVARLSAVSPRIRRAMALAEVGRLAQADVEMKWAQGETSPADDPILVGIAHHYGLASAQLSIAHYAGVTGHPQSGLAAGLFPLPDYQPTGGFTVDQALLYGLIRQESKFDPNATSKVGARGLMQLMPRTASYVAGTNQASRRLYDPGYNMQLGQSYVHQLLTRYNEGSGDLFEMALSYNWGPGNFSRWRARTPIEDQLLMLESVPNAEARHFVETVLTNIWVYRDRLGEPAPSRDNVAAGGRPIYKSVGKEI